MPKENKNFWNKYGFVIGSKNRMIVLKELDTPKTPLQLTQKTNLGMNMTSRALRELEKEGIVECKNPEAKVGRVYDLTDLGKEILKKIAKDWF